VVLENFIIRSPEAILKIGTPAFYLDNDSMVFVHEKKQKMDFEKVYTTELRTVYLLWN